MRYLRKTAAAGLALAALGGGLTSPALGAPTAPSTTGAPAEFAGPGSGAAAPAYATTAPAHGSFQWPVNGPVIRFFEPPPTPFSAGHRGIDIAVPFGTPVRAPSDGSVTFAGWVAGAMYVTLDHGGGVRTSYSWLSGFAVTKGDGVKVGQVIAFTGHGHPAESAPNLFFSVRVNGLYVDPLLFLGGLDLVDLIRLAPLG